jgi:hypothetical protein
MLQVNSQHPALKCHSGGVLIIYHAAISKKNASNGSTPKKKIMRGMHQAANDNFESKDLWQPASQAGRLQKLAALLETDS